MAEKKEYKTKIDLLKEGSFIKVYGSKTFINVASAFNIDKVRFSIVDIGTDGSNNLDIYLTVEEVRQLIKDIDSGVALKKIAADTGNYPTAYQWIKGQNGHKKLIIGGGQKGVRVQVSDSERKINKFAVIQISDLKELSFTFKLCSGLIPCQKGSYFDKMFTAFVENEQKFAENNNNREAPFESEDNSLNVIGQQVETLEFITNGNVIEKPGYKGIPVKVEGKEAILAFKENEIKALPWFKKFIVASEKRAVKLNAQVLRSGKNFVFVKTA